MTQDEIIDIDIDIDILEYLQFIIHKGIIPSDVTLNKAVAEIESLRAKLASQAQPTSQDAERFYDLGFKASGEGHNGEHGANITGDYYLSNRKKAIDDAMKESKT